MKNNLILFLGAIMLWALITAAVDLDKYNRNQALNLLIQGGGPDRLWSATLTSANTTLDSTFYCGGAIGRYSFVAEGDTALFLLHKYGGSWTTTQQSGSQKPLDGKAICFEQGMEIDSVRVIRPSASVEIMMIGEGWD